MNKRISNLNKQLGLSLGLVSDQPRYAWKRAAELFYFVKEGTKNVLQPQARGAGGLFLPGPRLILVEPRYRRYSWAEKFERDCWVLAQFKTPTLTPEQWANSIGLDFPYPYKGQYYAIENTQFDPEQEPDEEDTKMVIARIRAQESANWSEVLDMCRREAQKPIDDKKKEFKDIVDDFWPAFDNGKALEDKLGASRGGSVSFGGI